MNELKSRIQNLLNHGAELNHDVYSVREVSQLLEEMKTLIFHQLDEHLQDTEWKPDPRTIELCSKVHSKMMDDVIDELKESYSSYEFSDGNSQGETYYSLALDGNKVKVKLDDNKIIGDFIQELDQLEMRPDTFKKSVYINAEE